MVSSKGPPRKSRVYPLIEFLKRHELLNFLLRHMLIGIVIGWSCLAALLWTDVGGIWTLLSESDVFALGLAMLLVFFALTFGSLAMGSAVMGIKNDPPDETPTQD